MPRQKNVYALGAISFLNDISSKMILPILPLFIRELGGAGLAIGIITGLGDSFASLFKMLAGYWSDKMGQRKPFVFFGYTISAASKLLMAFATSWPFVLIFRLGERLGKGLRSAPRDAILAASTKKSTRGKAFGIHRAMDSAGAFVGSLITLALFWYFNFSFVTIFLAAGIFAFLAIGPLIFVKEHEYKENTHMKLKLGLKTLPSKLRSFIIIATIFSLGNFSYMFFVLRSEAFFAERLAIAIPIILYIIYNFSYSIFSIPAGMLSDKIGRKKVLIAGYALFGIICAGFIFAQSIWEFIILFILFGVNYAFVNTTQRAFVSDMSHERIRGTALGTFHMATSLAALPAGLIAGLLWDMSALYTFYFGGAIAIIAAISLAAFIPQKISQL